MYRDKDRQRAAVREATRRWRGRKGITRVSPEGITEVSREGITKVSLDRVSHDPVIPEMPEVWGGPEAWEAWRGDGPSVSSGRPVKSEWMRAKERQMEEFLRRYGKR